MLNFPKDAVGAVATIVAATVGGVVALLGLIISKEQKISEFRQQWIDALRTDLATLIAHQHSYYINRLSKDVDVNAAEKDKALANEMAARIRLRLNPNEDESRHLLDAISHHFNVTTGTTPKDINEASNHVVEVARLVLKKEWNRVRSGEVVYRIAKYVAAGVTIFFVCCVVVYAVQHLLHA